MDHDALNQAYDDEVSRLFRELCASTTSSGGKVSSEAIKKFEDGMFTADAAYDAVNVYWRERAAGMTRVG